MAWIQSLAQEIPYARGVAIKKLHLYIEQSTAENTHYIKWGGGAFFDKTHSLALMFVSVCFDPD